MIVCPQCKGKGSLANNQPLNVPNGVTFTNPTQVPVTTCPTCLGTKYFTGSST